MKRLAARNNKSLSLLTTALVTGSLVLSACQGGGFNTNGAEILRPPTSANPKVANDLQKLQNPQSSQYSQLETPVERDSFMNDLTEQNPTYSDEEIAQDAEDQYQKQLEKQREEKKKHEHQKQSGQPSEQQEPDEQPEPAKSGKNGHGTGYQPEKPSQPVTPAKPKPKTPQKPEAPVTPTTPKEGGAPAAPAKKPQQPAQPPAPAEQAPAAGDFCRRLKVVTGKGEMDLKELYNDDSALAKSMPTAELENLRSEEKKNRFVCVLLPIAIRMEEAVYKQRREVLRLQKKQADNVQLTAEDQAWLKKIKEDYYVDEKGSYADILARVDIVPLPLLLTMAALESGWGRSTVARKLKNLFGMHGNPKTQPCEYGYDHACMRKFDTISDNVAAYIELLNRGPYQKFRDARAKMRAERKALNSDVLLEALASSYNENPAKYIKDVRRIMSTDNNFGQFVFKEDQVEIDKK
ncbi:MAG: glucosaminidase domain-containing protein [Bdellovibrionales bacterium]|nr:glucosaminidase domain-containing protein [Bdellovibrionales bacterium]